MKTSSPHMPCADRLTTKLQHLDDAIAAVEMTLSEGEVTRLEAPYQPHPILGHS